MKHFSIKKISMALVLLVIGCTTLHARKKRHKDKECSVKYIKGGAPDGGNGSRQHPYNDLRAAQADFSWSKLIVLPSFVPLDYGITLRPGTKLIGELPDHPWPTVDCDFPIITNTTTAPTLSNGGNGVIVNGDATIENIHFQDTQASAIEYSNAQNLTVNNVLITGHNQGNVNFTDFLSDTYRVGGIFGQLTASGTTCLHNVVIRDNNSGDGIIEYALAGSNRSFIAKECVDISRLTTNVDETDPNEEAIPEINGIKLVAGQGALHCNEITCSIIHDFLQDDFPGIDFDTSGIRIESQDGQSCSTIEKCTFQNLEFGVTRHIFHISDGTTPMQQRITIKECLFKEREETISVNGAVVNTTNNGFVESSVLDSTIVNVFGSITTGLAAGTHHDTIVGNCVSTQDGFYNVLNVGPTTQTACIVNNNVRGGFNSPLGALFGAITLISAQPWEKLCIKVRNNCFTTPGFGILAIALSTASSNAIVDAGTPQDPGNNNIESEDFHINDFGAGPNGTGIHYLAQGNWWGPDGIPRTSVELPSTVDDSNPLPAPAKCPLKCTCDLGSNTLPTSTKIKIPTKEELEQIKEHYFKRFKLLTKTNHEIPATKDAPTEPMLSIEEELPTKKESDSVVARILKFFKLS